MRSPGREKMVSSRKPARTNGRGLREMKMFKKNRKKAETKIVRRVEQTVDVAPIKLAVANVLSTQRWDLRQEEFHGFDSPPGRF